MAQWFSIQNLIGVVTMNIIKAKIQRKVKQKTSTRYTIRMHFGLLISIMLCLFALTACQEHHGGSSETSTTASSQTTSIESVSTTTTSSDTSGDTNSNTTTFGNSATTNASLPTYVPGTIELLPLDSHAYEFEFVRQYRLCYYSLEGKLHMLACEKHDLDTVNDWTEEFFFGDPSTEPAEMVTVAFVKRFNISKEEFEAVIDENSGYFDEDGELPNADIVYTFDNAIINEYYRRE